MVTNHILHEVTLLTQNTADLKEYTLKNNSQSKSVDAVPRGRMTLGLLCCERLLWESGDLLRVLSLTRHGCSAWWTDDLQLLKFNLGSIAKNVGQLASTTVSIGHSLRDRPSLEQTPNTVVVHGVNLLMNMAWTWTLFEEMCRIHSKRRTKMRLCDCTLRL